MSQTDARFHDRLVSLRLPQALSAALRQLAAEQGLPQSELHRRALFAFMQEAIPGWQPPEPPEPTESTENSDSVAHKQ